MWILAMTSLLIFIGYILYRKNTITAVRLTVEKIVVSTLFLVVVNIIANQFGFRVGVNEYTISMVSVLGLPGLSLVVLLQNVAYSLTV